MTTLIACVIIILLNALLVFVLACAPGQNGQNALTEGIFEEGPAIEHPPFDWTAQSDCVICHSEESQVIVGIACIQDSSDDGTVCMVCHDQETTLKTLHEGKTLTDRRTKRSNVNTVDQQTCIACHGSLEDMAKKTTASTALIDSNGLVVNPHDRPQGQSHNELPLICTDCHNNHSQDLEKDAMKYCAQCHHRGIFQCGTCHELRDRTTS